MVQRQLTAALLAASVLVPAAALAQANGPAAPSPAPAAPAAATTAPSAADFVKNVALSDLFEIQSSQLASTKSQNDQVRQFAQKMIQDHTASTAKLKSAAAGQSIPTALDADHAQKLQQLQNAAAADFDRRYADLQVSGHQDALNLLDQYARSGDNAQLKQFAQDTLPTVRDHLQLATNLRTSLNAPDRVAGAGPNQPPSQNGAGAGGQIVVQQPGPAIRVDQAPPQVTVQQAQPSVTVQQQQPDITVRQPAPTVTVDIPQPEIIVRMPPPQVNVAQAQPQVQVNQPPPKVEVVPNQQQPQVNVAQGQSPANVQVQQDGTPTVHYEAAQPQVKVNQPQGQPTVRIEQLAQAGQGAPPANTTPGVTPPAAGATPPAAGATPPAAGARPQVAAATSQVTASDLNEMEIDNPQGQKLGDVADVVRNAGDNQVYIILGHGGFLGLGEKLVAIPVQNVWMQGKKLMVSGLTDAQIKAMPEWKTTNAGYQKLQAKDTVPVRLAAQ